MSRKYKSFRQKELDWGINLYSSPNEIDNKQAVLATNFNASWNKLIASKWKTTSLNVWTWFTQGFTVDWPDKYHIQTSNVYKNWTSLFLSNSYSVTFSSVNWNVFTFWLDGIIKWYKFWTFWTEEEALTNLLSTLQTDFPTYTISRALNVFTISKWWADLVINKPENQRKITVSNWWVSSEISVTVDWTIVSWLWTTYATADAFITYLENQLSDITYFKKKDWGVLHLVRKDGNIPVIASSSVDKYTYRFNARTDYLYWYQWGWGYWNRTEINFWWEIFTITWNWSNILEGSQVINWINLSASYNKAKYTSTNLGSISYMDFNKTNYISVSPLSFLNYYNNVWMPADGQQMSYTTTNIKATITVSSANIVIFNWVNTWLWLNNNELYNITVSQFWLLLVWYKLLSWVKLIYWDWTVNTISNAAVWTPTVGTIYQGKIILWWYIKDWVKTDSIVFSVTAGATTPWNLLIFTGYNAWVQLVSNGNKWWITGFKTSENWLYVFKENEIYYTNSENNNLTTVFNFIFNKITNNWALNQASITNVEQDIIYFDWVNKKTRRLSYEQNMTTLRDTSISEEITDILDEVQIPGGDLIHSYFKFPNYVFNYTKSNSPEINVWWVYPLRLPNYQLVYNVDKKSWFERTEFDNVSTYPLFADKWFVATIWTYIYEDFVWFSSSWAFLSKQYDMWDSIWYKRYTEFEIYWKKEVVVTLYVDVYEDWALYDTFTIDSNYWEEFRNRFDFFTEGKHFQFWLRYTGAWDLEVNEFAVAFKPIEAFDSFQW